MTLDPSVAAWLLAGDVSVQYQTRRDLLGATPSVLDPLRARIAAEGWGGRFLGLRDPATGLWGGGAYSPKWISTHYTLLELKNLGLDPLCPQYRESAGILLDKMWFDHGRAKRQGRYQDLCVGAMLLSICCYAGLRSPKLEEIADYILGKSYPDGGWNCEWERGDRHSSLHTTLSVLEAFRDCEAHGYAYRLGGIRASVPAAWEFILRKRLFRSERTGDVVDPKMLMLSYPCRWKYDILRCLDYFASVGKSYDGRMDEALERLLKKRRADGRWPVQQKYSGKVHFDMEPTGGPSRWNTLRALRVLKFYGAGTA